MEVTIRYIYCPVAGDIVGTNIFYNCCLGEVEKSTKSAEYSSMNGVKNKLSERRNLIRMKIK